MEDDISLLKQLAKQMFDDSSDSVYIYDTDIKLVYYNKSPNNYETEYVKRSIDTREKLSINDKTFFPLVNSHDNIIGGGCIVRNTSNQIDFNSFLTTMVHDLKNPVASIIGFAHLIEYTTKGDTNYAQLIARSGKKLITLIDDVLILNTIPDISYDVINIQFIINDIIETHMADITRKNLQVSLSLQVTEIESSELHIKHILLNLISNAIKYTDNNGSVTIESYIYKDKIIIKISDTGIGIPNKFISRLFKPFERLTNFAEGTGLGLYIAKTLAEKIGGKINVSSKEYEGSQFTIEL